jgi:hypothetical protein
MFSFPVGLIVSAREEYGRLFEWMLNAGVAKEGLT